MEIVWGLAVESSCALSSTTEPAHAPAIATATRPTQSALFILIARSFPRFQPGHILARLRGVTTARSGDPATRPRGLWHAAGAVDYLDRLSTWAATTPLEVLPAAVRERACLVIADSLGVTAHGMQAPEMREFVARHLADERSGRASVIGAGRRADPASAALLNGTAGTWIDMNEGNLYARGHPGIQVVPLAWALAEHEGRSGRELLAAFVAGYEVSARIKRSSATRLAVHPHGTFGTIGAAVALARLLGYTAAATREIINVSATLGIAASRRALTTGATVRNVYTGLSGSMGWLAHTLVQSGFTGEPDAVSSVYGAIYADRFDTDAAVSGLGEEFLLPRGFIKVHACGRYIHGALDCVETLTTRHHLPPDSIQAISVRTYALAASLGHADVRSEFGARFSLPFAVASLLCHGRSGLDNYVAAAVADPRIQALARRVEVVEDPEFTRAFPERQPTEVMLVLADGTEMSERSDFHRGEAENPHPPDAVRKKFLDLSAPVWGRGRAEVLFDRVLDLERVPDVAALLGNASV
ncbi:MAG: 2-methylcitrate dehydratase [Candidatus Rokuibacteriota bacterium]|nr:MAG: 2-methylcitrate dehydratase [Candidatus Rokubacteria bacterium]